MRQIELHRADPSVPLIPPPHPVTAFLKKNWIYIFLTLLNTANLIKAVSAATGPLTRKHVLTISLSIAGLLLVVILLLIRMTIDMLRRFAKHTWDALDGLHEVDVIHSEWLRKHGEEIVHVLKHLQDDDAASQDNGSNSDSPAKTSDSPQPKQIEAPKT